MRVKILIIVLNLCALLLAPCVNASGAGDPSGQRYADSTLESVEALYGLDKDEAVTRLDREYAAAVEARRIEDLRLPDYAGTWFDSVSENLHVATASEVDFDVIRKVGAIPVLVTHSLQQLELARKEITDALSSRLGHGIVLKSYVDVRANTVVLGIREDETAQASSFLSTLHLSVPFQIKSVFPNPVGFSSTNLYGADGTINHTFDLAKPADAPHPCSVGASAENVNGTTYTAGYVTAGHCGAVSQIIEFHDGTSLGTVMASTFDPSFIFTNNEDGAWVQTVSGWLPKPQLNGYNAGTLNISGTWAGMLAAPVGTTVCRYGEASQHEYCDSVTALNVTVCLACCGNICAPAPEVDIVGLIEVDGICTDAGDSGGPLFMPSGGQLQGTTTGGDIDSCVNKTSNPVTYYQPIATTIATATGSLSNKPVAMLTSHGRSASTLSTYLCPNVDYSGAFTYWCDFSSYDSQGATSVFWTSSTGASSSGSILHGPCTVGQNVYVTLTLTNPYGTTFRSSSFTCPSYPL